MQTIAMSANSAEAQLKCYLSPVISLSNINTKKLEYKIERLQLR